MLVAPNTQAAGFIRSFVDQDKPIGVICHGPWTLVEADAVRGRTLTSWPSLRTDTQNAGGTSVDEEVVRDDQLVSAGSPTTRRCSAPQIVDLFALEPAASS